MSDNALRDKVFLVEDGEPVRRSLQFQMEAMGYDVEAYPSAYSFLEKYHPCRNSCLLLDVRMPGMTGIELQQLLRDKNDPIPVVMISGHADVPAAVRAMKNGAVDFLSKPVSTAELSAALKFALNKPATEPGLEPSEKADDIRSRIDSLTPRETEVLDFVVDGFLKSTDRGAA